MTDLDVLSLATWRLAYMITGESGPYHVFESLRKEFNPGGLFDCIYCTSVWVAAVVLVLWFSPFRPLVWVLAVSGKALQGAVDSGVMPGNY